MVAPRTLAAVVVAVVVAVVAAVEAAVVVTVGPSNTTASSSVRAPRSAATRLIRPSTQAPHRPGACRPATAARQNPPPWRSKKEQG